MSLAIAPCYGNQYQLDELSIERIILKLSDMFKVRIVFNRETAVLTGLFAVAGGLIGGYAGGRVGVAVGAAVGGGTGLAVSTFISLSEIWHTIKSKVRELFYVVYNFLRRLDATDYTSAVKILFSSYSTKMELALAIVAFMTDKLGYHIISAITAA